MSEPLTIPELRKLLNDSAYRLQTFPGLKDVDSDTARLFDKLAQETNYMFSYIIDYLDQNR